MQTGETIKLDSNAWLYFLAQKAGGLIALLIFVLVFTIGDHHSIKINGHPPTESQIGFLNKLGSGFAILCFLFAVGISALFSWLRADSYGIDLRPEGVHLKYGVVNLYSETLLFSKIQDITVNRRLLERLFGLSTLTIQNAFGQPEILPGLSEAVAEELRNTILSHVTR